MNQKRRFIFWLTLFLALIAAYVSLPPRFPLKIKIGSREIHQTVVRPGLNFKFGPIEIKNDLVIHQGLDLAGGVRLVFLADATGVAKEDQETAVSSAREVISRRVDLFGLSEPTVRTSKVGDEYRIEVELAGVDEPDEAIELIGQTAQLEFQLINEATDSASLFEPTGLTGQYLKKASPNFDPNTGQPIVSLEFSPEGGELFGRITNENVGRRLGIFLDEGILMAPVINEPIDTGQAQITGDFQTEDVKRLAAQLNGGALPLPFELIEQRQVGPTLGQESIALSIRAGLIGLAMVAVFMIVFYGREGVISVLGLIVYGLLTMAAYKLIPVTVTLPGIAGFILTVGMAVDSNILIFERIKEELRSGQSLTVARELGFGRAWDSIRDANICTLIICFILFNPFEWSFLNTSGPVRGFAVTLGIGIFMSLLTGIVFTRSFMETLLPIKEKK